MTSPNSCASDQGLRAVAEGTELTFTHSRLRDEESRRSHEEGWTGALDKLERHFLAAERSFPTKHPPRSQA